VKFNAISLFSCTFLMAAKAFAFDPLFSARIDYDAGSTPSWVFASDLDGDGYDDLAVANLNSDNLSVLRNNGDGTFQVPLNNGVGNGPVSVFASDLDGDGDNDLAVANFNSDNVSVLRNYGDGTFQAVVNYGASQLWRGEQSHVGLRLRS